MFTITVILPVNIHIKVHEKTSCRETNPQASKQNRFNEIEFSQHSPHIAAECNRQLGLVERHSPLAALCHHTGKVNVRQLSEPSQQRMKNTVGHEAGKQRVRATLRSMHFTSWHPFLIFIILMPPHCLHLYREELCDPIFQCTVSAIPTNCYCRGATTLSIAANDQHTQQRTHRSTAHFPTLSSFPGSFKMIKTIKTKARKMHSLIKVGTFPIVNNANKEQAIWLYE